MSRKGQTYAKRRVRRASGFLVTGALLIAAAPFLAWCAAQFLIVKADVPVADAIVVLSGSSTYIERADWAAKLYREGRAPLIILTNDGVIGGWDHREERNPFYYELSARRLEQQGVPAARIQVVPEKAQGTYEESLLIRDFAVTKGLNRLVIVTSGYHSRRALWSMRRAFDRSRVEVGIDSAPPGSQTPSPWLWWSGRWGWKLVAGEYLKLIYYWVKY
jgi:uncharacterized SAM-binding protein YcdF (DUF218 family)